MENTLNLRYPTLHNAWTNPQYFARTETADYVPEDKIWRDQKFVGCADAI